MEGADQCKENGKYERTNILCEIIYILSVCMSGDILEYQKVGKYAPDGNQAHLLFYQLSRKDPIKAIKC